MNRNPKEKLARIEIRVKSKDKDKIKRLAENVNLSISEYMVQRALGYEPITVLPNAFFDFYNYRIGSRVYGVFHQFFNYGHRALYDFACCYFICYLFV